MRLTHTGASGGNLPVDPAIPLMLPAGGGANPSAGRKIRLLVVDDDPLVRKAITLCMARSKNMEVVGTLEDARQVVTSAHDLRPDVVLMDISMPEMNGVTATSWLQEELPEVKVLILSIHQSKDNLRDAMTAGARGFALKGTSAGELVRAVEAVQRGEIYLSREMMLFALDEFQKGDRSGATPRLTKREREVLVLAAEGRSNKEAAAKLGVSVRTVETHRENLMRKLDIHTIAGLTRYALANGYISARSE